jgi:hypothetical protein
VIQLPRLEETWTNRQVVIFHEAQCHGVIFFLKVVSGEDSCRRVKEAVSLRKEVNEEELFQTSAKEAIRLKVQWVQGISLEKNAAPLHGCLRSF